MVETSVAASTVGVAGAGFRLSLILNAVGAEIADTDVEIQTIARGISSYSLMLKQVGLTIQSTRTLASQSAIDTVSQMAKQSQSLFDEVKKMVEMVQKQDDKGHIQSISIAQRVTWCFKKQRVQYMLGQLECLKLSLSLMLQVLQLGKTIASQHEDPQKQPLSEHEMLQERAEIQNMVVVRHWSLVDLRRLYQHAEHEDLDAERPLRIHNGHTPAKADPRLQIEGPKDESDPSTAMVKYQATPLSHLDASMNKAMYLPNRLLHAPDDNIVDQLLDEWTRLRETSSRSPRSENKYKSRYDSDDDSSSSVDFDRSNGTGGHYIEGPRSKKNVRFRARVESDSEDSDKNRRRRKHSSRHLLHSDEDTDSSSSSLPSRSQRRNSDGSSTRRGPSSREPPNERDRRPYTSPYIPSPNDPNPVRPSPRGGAPQSRPMPMQTPSQTWQNQQHPASPGLRPPSYNPTFPPSLQRMPSGGMPYFNPPPPSYSTSPNTPRNYTPQPQPQGLGPPSYNDSHHRGHRKRSPRSDKPKKEKNGSRFSENAKKDVKRGLLGAGAVAGLMDILEGLGGI